MSVVGGVTKSVHQSIMVDEVIEMINAKSGGDFLDCTFGGGGHTAALLNAHPKNRVTAIDRDVRALERGRARFGDESRLSLMHGSFSTLRDVLQGATFDGVLADLGLSTDQLKEGRGFSFADTGSLDMRMNEQEGLTAAELINTISERELLQILRDGGVGREACSVAAALIRKRPFSSAAQIADAILSVNKQNSPVHPATVPLQAIRMAVNQELEEIDALLEAMPSVVKSGGRLSLITFHSLEDKAVMKMMRSWEQGGEFSAQWPGAVRQPSKGTVVTRKPICPSDDEIKRNNSARSARLRVFQFV